MDNNTISGKVTRCIEVLHATSDAHARSVSAFQLHCMRPWQASPGFTIAVFFHQEPIIKEVSISFGVGNAVTSVASFLRTHVHETQTVGNLIGITSPANFSRLANMGHIIHLLRTQNATKPEPSTSDLRRLWDTYQNAQDAVYAWQQVR
jgi:hypothetical protein